MLGGHSELDKFEEQNRHHCGSQGKFCFLRRAIMQDVCVLMGISHHRGDVQTGVDNREKPLQRTELTGSRAQGGRFHFSRIGGPYFNLIRRKAQKICKTASNVMSFVLEIGGNSPWLSSSLSKSLAGTPKADPTLLVLLPSLLAAGLSRQCLPGSQCPVAGPVVSRGRQQGTCFAGTNHSC